MTIRTESFADVVVLAPAFPRIDHTTADVFQDEFMPLVERALDDSKAIVVEMRAVEYMSSIGLRVLMVAAKKVKARPARIAVAGLTPAMREIFEIGKFHLVVDTFDEVEDALTALSETAKASFEARPARPKPTGRRLIVRFWGTRGSLPVSMRGEAVRERIRKALRKAVGRDLRDDEQIDAFIDTELDFATRHSYGGSTSCVEVDTDAEDYLLCDMGTGLRHFGQRVMARHGAGVPQTYHFLLSHVHWDHIMGFPFFTPAYIPGNTIRIYGCHDVLEQAFRRQHSDPSFPVDFEQLGAHIEFVKLQPGESYEIAGLQVSAILQPHHGDSYGYRLETAGKSVVYTTDAEHKLESREQDQAFVEFFRGADLVIFDAMYSLADMITVREDWGHSSNIIGVDLCHRARVKHYCMFHHEPVCDDGDIQRILQETIRYEELTREGPPLQVSSAYDGMEIVV